MPSLDFPSPSFPFPALTPPLWSLATSVFPSLKSPWRPRVGLSFCPQRVFDGAVAPLFPFLPPSGLCSLSTLTWGSGRNHLVRLSWAGRGDKHQLQSPNSPGSSLRVLRAPSLFPAAIWKQRNCVVSRPMGALVSWDPWAGGYDKGLLLVS